MSGDQTNVRGTRLTRVDRRPTWQRITISYHLPLSRTALPTQVSLQGIQAVYTIAIHAGGKVPVPGHPISSVFFLLAILGLLILPAALWLTDEYGYCDGKDPEPQGEGDDVELNKLLAEKQA